MMLRDALAVLTIVGAALLVAACTSNTTDTTNTTPGPAPTAINDGAISGLIIPAAFTPLTVQPISQPTFPFTGTDNKIHLAFDVQITNATAMPASLDTVDVVDAHDATMVLASFSGKQLVDPTCSYGDCNRLRLLTQAPAPDFSIPPQISRALLLDLTLDTLTQFPKAVLLRLHGTGANSPAAKDPVRFSTLGYPFDISAGTPRVISPPLRQQLGRTQRML
jgi:hypothetical protein